MQPLDLIDTARKLAEVEAGRPREANLRRASSTIYYALFHALCRNCADYFVGRQKARRDEKAWVQAYRALQHRQTKNRLSETIGKARFSPAIQAFGSAFVTAQAKRILADYDPLPFRIAKSQVLTDLEEAETAIRQFSKIPASESRALIAWVVFTKRPE